MVDIFVVHGQQAALRTFECIVVNAIVVHAKLSFLLGGSVAGIVFERMVLAHNAYGVAPRCNDVSNVAFWNSDAVCQRNGHTFEANFGCWAHAHGCTASEGSRATNGAEGRQKAAGQCAQATAQHLAARGLRHVVNAGVGRAVAVFHQGKVFCHGDVCG